MKYMGSKRSMLGNGLGEVLEQALDRCNRVYDPFTGSAAVAWYVAQNYEKTVIASDLQSYATVLAASVVERTKPLDSDAWTEQWFQHARELMCDDVLKVALDIQSSLCLDNIATVSVRAQSYCSGLLNMPITQAYGGHYFSPLQALWFDVLRKKLPVALQEKQVALAALVIAASQSVAAPGHTAQPFKPNSSAGPFLIEAWSQDILFLVKRAVQKISKQYSLNKGMAVVADANEIVSSTTEGDLVFLDPPYSSVHYSRFYHVLETIAVGYTGEVTGIGRYPPQSERPRSEYSLKAKAKSAFDELLNNLSRRGASAIITFPAGAASNGLAGKDVIQLSTQYFRIEKTRVASRFSTMGGDKRHRAARHSVEELILSLTPK